MQARHVDDGEVRRVRGAIDDVRHVDEEVLGKQAVPRLFGDDAHAQAITRVRPRIAILDEELASLDVVGHPPMERIEELRLDRPVHFAPPHFVLARRLAHDEFVVG